MNDETEKEPMFTKGLLYFAYLLAIPFWMMTFLIAISLYPHYLLSVLIIVSMFWAIVPYQFYRFMNK